ncbi:MAG TPA: hypothetical protein VGN14_02635 [Candidatus Elarobacter sp.]|jgi:outer membrane lipoprotein-sorting protein
MKNRRFALLAAVAIAALIAPVRTVAAGSESELYARMQRVNAGLTSYQADVTAAVVSHGFPYLNPTLQGHAYFKRPDKNAVIFDTLPIIAQQVKHVVATIEPPSEWPSVYDVTPTGDDGTAGTFKLVRKKNGRIDHIDVKVDDKTATVIGMTYYYKEGGGTIAVTQTYDQINGNYVVKTQTGKVDIPHYNADVTSTFGNYKLNVPVDDKVFENS